MEAAVPGGSTSATLCFFVRPLTLRLPSDAFLFFGMVRACVDFFFSPPPSDAAGGVGSQFWCPPPSISCVAVDAVVDQIVAVVVDQTGSSLPSWSSERSRSDQTCRRRVKRLTEPGSKMEVGQTAALWREVRMKAGAVVLPPSSSGECERLRQG